MKNKVIKYIIIVYTGVLSILGVCQYLGVPNLDMMPVQARVVLGATIWWLGVVGVAGNIFVCIKFKQLKSLAFFSIILCIVVAIIGGFHHYLAANWK